MLFSLCLISGFALVTGSIVKLLCDFRDISDPIASILCAVEMKRWSISVSSLAINNLGCLLGGKRCDSVMLVPLEEQVSKSPPPPKSKSEEYQKLATIAEQIVPKTWWRDGFANDLLLLSHNDSELPRKQFDVKQLSNKKLKNMLQCVTKQQFIRKSFKFTIADAEMGSGCTSMTQPVVKSFLEMWKKDIATFGGEWKVDSPDSPAVWYPMTSGKLLLAALDVLDHFFQNYGGIWTGCMKLEKSSDCRGALAGQCGFVLKC